MKVEKITLDPIRRCYCAGSMEVDGETALLFASEDPESSCFCYRGRDFTQRETVWQDRGGCMSIIPIPQRKNEFLAVTEFYLKVSPSQAKLVWGKREEGGWKVRDVLSLPFLHRFDLYHKHGITYFIGATIAEDKENKEDWSRPGKIYVGVLPQDPSSGMALTCIQDGCYRNHGYCRGFGPDGICGYFSSDQGVLRVTPPEEPNGTWKIEKLLDAPVGEIALADVDNDGREELMTIEPFHGNTVRIYKQTGNTWNPIYTYPHKIDFAHALVGTTLRGHNCFIGGIRRVDAELFVVGERDGALETVRLDTGGGPANLHVVHQKDRDLILAANHTANEAAIYAVSDFPL